MKNLTWQNPEQLFVAQELINKVKSKCCGIKVKEKVDEIIKTEEYIRKAAFMNLSKSLDGAIKRCKGDMHATTF